VFGWLVGSGDKDDARDASGRAVGQGGLVFRLKYQARAAAIDAKLRIATPSASSPSSVSCGP
jgi:hypothetical protein